MLKRSSRAWVTVLASVSALALAGCGGSSQPELAGPGGGGAESSPSEAVSPTVGAGIPRPPDRAYARTVGGPCPGDARIESAFAGVVAAVDESGPAPWVTFEVDSWFTDDLGERFGLWAPGWEGKTGQRWLVAATRYQSGALPSGDVIPCESEPWTPATRRDWDSRWNGSVLAGADTPESPADAQVLARLEEGHAQWEGSAPSDWTAVVTLTRRNDSGQECGDGPVRVVVQEHSIVQAIDLNRDCAVQPDGAPTIEDLFVEARRVAGALEGELQLDDKYGFIEAMYAHDRSVEVSLGVADFLPRALPLADDNGRDHADARDRWDRAGIDDYRMVVDVRCFCPFSGPVTVDVADGELRSVDTTDDQNYQGTALTVDAIFEEIAAAQTDGDVDVAYDPDLGYPITADLDPILNAIDDEISYRILTLDPTR